MKLTKLIGFFAFIVSVYILWQIRQILLLAFAAVVFATALNRLVRLLLRFHIKRGIAVFLSVGLVLALLAGFFAVVVPPFIEQLQQLVDLVPDGLEKLRSWSKWLQDLLPEQLLQDIRNLKNPTQQVQSIAPRLFGNFFNLFSSSLEIVLNILLVLVLTIMLLANPSPYRHVFTLLFPAFYRKRVDDILQKCEVALGGWVTGILFNMTVIAVLSGIGLGILQVPLPLTNALLAGVLTFIPNLGPTLSVIPPMALALLDAPWKAGAVLVLYILIQQLESDVLTPLVMKKQVSLLPAITLLSQAIFAVFFGFLGLFLALPITIVAQVWLNEVLVKDVLNKWQGEASPNYQQTSVQQQEGSIT